MKRFEDKTILVTGASSGIGRSVAKRVADEGGRVILVSRNYQELQNTVKYLPNSPRHFPISCDLMDLDNYQEIFGSLKENNIKLNGMVHCAGISEITPLRTMKYHNAMKLFQIHYFAFVELVKNFAKKGVSDGGSIVGISAINAHVPQKCMTAYASAKAAMETACRTLALELVDKNIRINSVIVGGVSTKMSEEISTTIANVGTTYENPVQRQILGVSTPEQVAGTITFLLSEDSSCITGRELYADGGLL